MRCIKSKKRIVSILLSVALLITMLPPSISHAAENLTVEITDFNGDVKFQNSNGGKNPNNKINCWSLMIRDRNGSVLNDSDIGKVQDGLDDNAIYCLRSFVFKIKVSGTVTKEFTPCLNTKYTGCTWYSLNVNNTTVNCEQKADKITGPGEYTLTFTINEEIKDTTSKVFTDPSGSSYFHLSTLEDDSATANPQAEIVLTSMTVNKELLNGAELTQLNAQRQRATSAINAETVVTWNGNKSNLKNFTANSISNVNTAYYAATGITVTDTQDDVDKAANAIKSACDALISTESLWTACNQANDKALQDGHVKADYTTESWNALDAAIQAALALPDDAAATKIAELTKAVNDASAALRLKSEVPVKDEKITKLETALNPYRGRTEDSYTPETWAVYKAVRDRIQAIIDDPPADLTDEQVDALITDFNEAVDGMQLLDTKDAKEALQKAIDDIKAKNYNKADYTAESWEVFANALKVAENYATGTGQTMVAVINEAKDNLLQAETDLKKAQKVDKEDGVYLDYKGRWKKQDKDNSSMQGYVADGASAEINLDDWWFDIRDIDLSDLEYPVLEVEYEANGDTLQIAYNTTGTTGWNDANPVITSSSESSGKYKVSLADMKDMKYLLLTSNAAEVVYSRVKIYDDKAGAVTEAKKALDDAVSKAGKLKKDDYTAETWSVLEKALEAAEKITESSTVTEINAAKKAVDDAIAGLKKVPTEPSASPSVSPSTPPSSGPTTSPTAKPTNPPEKAPAKGAKVSWGKLVYKVTKAATTKQTGTLTVVTLSSAGKKSSKLSIPATATIKGYKYKVTKLGNNVFKGAKAKSITLGMNITAIPKGAFAKCQKLNSLTIKAKLKSVKKGAFKGCKKTIKLKGGSKKVRKANLKKLKKCGYKKFK